MTDNIEQTDQGLSQPRSFREMLLYKMDRTIAIFGIVVIGFYALVVYSTKNADSLQVSLTALGALGGYIGGRAVGAVKKEG